MKKLTQETGQATIEFILTFVFGLSLMLMIFNSAMNYATGYLVHYATFMASRVYLTSELHSGNYGSFDFAVRDAERDARAAFQQYNLGIFGVDESEFFVNTTSTNQTGSQFLTVGAYSRYTQRVDMLGRVTGNTELDLVSESFLGKEPPRVYCAERTCFAITGSENCESADLDITLFDNGC